MILMMSLRVQDRRKWSAYRIQQQPKHHHILYLHIAELGLVALCDCGVHVDNIYVV